MDSQDTKSHRKVRRDYAFSGPIRCGHCGCAIVVKIKDLKVNEPGKSGQWYREQAKVRPR